MEVLCNHVKLFYMEKGSGDTAFLCIHSTGGDHRLFLPQLEHFSKWGRVVAVDLRGHGKSDKPKKSYSIETFADDLACLCEEIALRNIIAIGSSFGGNIGVDLACRYPGLIKGIVLLDSALFLTAKIRKVIAEYRKKFLQNDPSILEELIQNSCLPTDQTHELMRDAYKEIPSHVWSAAFGGQLKWDRKSKALLACCRTPILFVESGSPTSDRSQLTNLKEFYKVYPTLMTGKVVGAGHYPSIDAPDQVHAMILQFLRLKNIL